MSAHGRGSDFSRSELGTYYVVLPPETPIFGLQGANLSRWTGESDQMSTESIDRFLDGQSTQSPSPVIKEASGDANGEVYDREQALTDAREQVDQFYAEEL